MNPERSRTPLWVLALLLCCRCINAIEGSISAHQMGYFDELHETSPLKRVGNVGVAEDSDTSNDESIAFCHVPGLYDLICHPAPALASYVYKEVAAAFLAMHHFNNGIGTVVKELEGINKRCPIRLTGEVIDTSFRPTKAVQAVSSIIHREESKPCAFIGARSSDATAPSAVVSGVFGYPQMSYTATSPRLSDADDFPYFRRIIASDDEAAKAVVSFLTQVSRTTHVAILTVADVFGTSYNKNFVEAAAKSGIVTRSFIIDEQRKDEQDIKTQLKLIKDTGFRHIVLIVYATLMDQVFEQADALGLIGDDYFWVLGMSGITEIEEGSILEKVGPGMAIIPELGAKIHGESYDGFKAAMNNLGDEAISFLNSKMPLKPGSNETCFAVESGFFSEMNKDDPGIFSHLAYDTVVSIGLGACGATKNATYFDGQQHADAISEVKFEGASGYVVINPETNTRDPSSWVYSVNTIERKIGPNGNETFEVVEVLHLEPIPDQNAWFVEKHKTFFFADGSIDPPVSLPAVDVDMNYLGNLVVYGYVTFLLVALIS